MILKRNVLGKIKLRVSGISLFSSIFLSIFSLHIKINSCSKNNRLFSILLISSNFFKLIQLTCIATFLLSCKSEKTTSIQIQFQSEEIRFNCNKVQGYIKDGKFEAVKQNLINYSMTMQSNGDSLIFNYKAYYPLPKSKEITEVDKILGNDITENLMYEVKFLADQSGQIISTLNENEIRTNLDSISIVYIKGIKELSESQKQEIRQTSKKFMTTDYINNKILKELFLIHKLYGNNISIDTSLNVFEDVTQEDYMIKTKVKIIYSDNEAIQLMCVSDIKGGSAANLLQKQFDKKFLSQLKISDNQIESIDTTYYTFNRATFIPQKIYYVRYCDIDSVEYREEVLIEKR
jgi:hypothetical protein